MAQRVFAVVAHPDDIEFSMAGTLHLLHDAGCDIHYMNIANGSCGSLEYSAEACAAIRLKESQNAAAQIPAHFHPPLCNDMEIFYDKELLAQLASTMRSVAPDILLVHSLHDYMEDHMNAARLAISAAFTRGMRNFPVQPHHDIIDKPIAIYHAQAHGNGDQYGRKHLPDFYIDIDSVIERKTKMLTAHASQKEWLDVSQGMDAYLETMKSMSADLGTESGTSQYAEAWTRHNHLGLCDAASDPLGEILKIIPQSKNTN